MAHVVQVDLTGQSTGGVRSGRIALKAVAKNDPFAVPIASNERATSDTSDVMRSCLKQLSAAGVEYVPVFEGLRTVKYKDLENEARGKVSEEDFYQWLGLEIMERDGLIIPLRPEKKLKKDKK